jgi:predicted esterase
MSSEARATVGLEPRLIAARVHGRYFLEPASEGSAGAVLIGFHGYGENAERHLDELRRIPGARRWTLCAVQALHPFYNKTGEVIGCWMTRLDRERAIEDNIRYVNSVVAAVRDELGALERLVYLGFSQGAAMAYRAASTAVHPCHGVVVLGGDVPPELETLALAGFPPVLLGRGSSEEWYDAAKMEHDVELLRSKGVDVRPFIFTGGHEWTDAFRGEAGRFLAEVRRPAC